MRFTAIYPAITNITDDAFSLHAAGCGAIRREADRRAGSTETFTAESVMDALDHVIDDELVEMGYSHGDVKVHACCGR